MFRVRDGLQSTSTTWRHTTGARHSHRTHPHQPSMGVNTMWGGWVWGSACAQWKQIIRLCKEGFWASAKKMSKTLKSPPATTSSLHALLLHTHTHTQSLLTRPPHHQHVLLSLVLKPCFPGPSSSLPPFTPSPPSNNSSHPIHHTYNTQACLSSLFDPKKASRAHHHVYQ